MDGWPNPSKLNQFSKISTDDSVCAEEIVIPRAKIKIAATRKIL